MEWVETTGKSVADAIGQALDVLGVDEHDAEIEIVEEPKAGLFGLRKSDARIRARVRPAAPRPKRPQRNRRSRSGKEERQSSAPRSAAQESPKQKAPQKDGGNASGNRQRKPRPEGTKESARQPRAEEVPTMSVEEQAETVRSFVAGVVERFGLDATTTVRTEEEQITVEVTGAELGLLIGQRGATLDALQELARTVVQRRSEEHGARIAVDVAGFRAKRAAALAAFARQVADEVRSTGSPEALEPMSSSDRKIVHDTINEIDGVETTSEGAEPRRYVVVRPTTAEVPAEV